jgi:ABC-type transport system involved in multi-copper enzyme maturation permease subunit
MTQLAPRTGEPPGGGNAGAGITYTHGLVVAVCYIAVAVAATSVTFARRDVTA